MRGRRALLATLSALPAGAAWLFSLGAAAPPPVAVPAHPARIVSLVPSVTETIWFLGAGARMVGRSDYCDAPPEAAALPALGGFYDPDLERLGRLHPDLVFIEGRQEWLAERLAGLGIASRGFDLSTVDAVLRSVEDLADLLEVGPAARARVAALARDLAVAPPPTTPPPRVLWVHYRDPGTLEGMLGLGPGGHTDDLLRRAGAVNVLGDSRRMAPALTAERVLGLAPDVILDDVRAIADRPGWEARARATWAPLLSQPALAHTRLAFLTDDLAYRPGPRIGEALARIRALVHGGAGDP